MKDLSNKNKLKIIDLLIWLIILLTIVAVFSFCFAAYHLGYDNGRDDGYAEGYMDGKNVVCTDVTTENTESESLEFCLVFSN